MLESTEINLENIVAVVRNHDEQLRDLNYQLKMNNSITSQVQALGVQVDGLEHRVSKIEEKLDFLTVNTTSMSKTIRDMYLDVVAFIKENSGAAIKIQDTINEKIVSLKKEFKDELADYAESTANKYLIRLILWAGGAIIAVAGTAVGIWEVIK